MNTPARIWAAAEARAPGGAGRGGNCPAGGLPAPGPLLTLRRSPAGAGNAPGGVIARPVPVIAILPPMKAQRRHELQTNTLARNIGGAPEWLRQNATTMILVVAAAVLGYSIFRFRANARVQRQLTAVQSLATLRGKVHSIGEVYAQMSMSDMQRAELRAGMTEEAQTAFDAVTSNTDDSEAALRAMAYLEHGNLNWTLANLPALPASATQPALAVREPAQDLLDAAASDYQHVVDHYPDQTMAKASALFGLAAVAENQRDFDGATKHYQQIVDDASLPQMLRDSAKQRMHELDSLRRPQFFGVYPRPTPSTRPTSGPAGPSPFVPAPTGLGPPAPGAEEPPTLLQGPLQLGPSVPPTTTEPAGPSGP